MIVFLVAFFYFYKKLSVLGSRKVALNFENWEFLKGEVSGGFQ